MITRRFLISSVTASFLDSKGQFARVCLKVIQEVMPMTIGSRVIVRRTDHWFDGREGIVKEIGIFGGQTMLIIEVPGEPAQFRVKSNEVEKVN